MGLQDEYKVIKLTINLIKKPRVARSWRLLFALVGDVTSCSAHPAKHMYNARLGIRIIIGPYEINYTLRLNFDLIKMRGSRV